MYSYHDELYAGCTMKKDWAGFFMGIDYGYGVMPASNYRYTIKMLNSDAGLAPTAQAAPLA